MGIAFHVSFSPCLTPLVWGEKRFVFFLAEMLLSLSVLIKVSLSDCTVYVWALRSIVCCEDRGSKAPFDEIHCPLWGSLFLRHSLNQLIAEDAINVNLRLLSVLKLIDYLFDFMTVTAFASCLSDFKGAKDGWENKAIQSFITNKRGCLNIYIKFQEWAFISKVKGKGVESEDSDSKLDLISIGSDKLTSKSQLLKGLMVG